VEPVYDGVRALVYPPLHFGVRWTLQGLDRLPTEGPVILASNHVSYLDPLALGYLATKRGRRTRFLAKEELFAKRGFGAILRGSGMISVSRGTASAAGSLDAAEAALRAGRCVAVFVEGTISLDLEPMVGKTGAARLAAATGVSVVPVGLWGLHRVLFKGRKPRWRAGVAEVACLGPPLSVAADEDVLAATDRIMGAICEQVGAARTAYPQAPAPGEGDWWVRGPETAVVRSCRA
jgi:1-acyl-sn-glycerol-3-phosphate acyltransferase